MLPSQVPLFSPSPLPPLPLSSLFVTRPLTSLPFPLLCFLFPLCLISFLSPPFCLPSFYSSSLLSSSSSFPLFILSIFYSIQFLRVHEIFQEQLDALHRQHFQAYKAEVLLSPDGQIEFRSMCRISGSSEQLQLLGFLEGPAHCRKFGLTAPGQSYTINPSCQGILKQGGVG